MFFLLVLNPGKSRDLARWCGLLFLVAAGSSTSISMIGSNLPPLGRTKKPSFDNDMGMSMNMSMSMRVYMACVMRLWNGGKV